MHSETAIEFAKSSRAVASDWRFPPSPFPNNTGKDKQLLKHCIFWLETALANLGRLRRDTTQCIPTRSSM